MKPSAQDSKIKPKNLAKIFSKAVEKIGGKTNVVRADSTMPRGWDSGVIVVLDITLPKESSFQATLTLNIAKGDKDEVPEASGTMIVPSNLGGVISTQRGKDPFEVATRLISDFSSHFSSSKSEDVIRGMTRLLESLPT